MVTLYDLLGADPKGDKESLKACFRKAVKATHPDIHPGDPDAPSRVNQVVRAHAILSDAELRAAYDHLLAFERRHGANSRRTMLASIGRKIVSDAAAVVVLATVLFGGYMLFTHLAGAPVAAKPVEATAPGPVLAALAEVSQPRTAGRDPFGEVASPAPANCVGTSHEAIAPDTVAVPTVAAGNKVTAVASRDPGLAWHDADANRTRGSRRVGEHAVRKANASAHRSEAAGAARRSARRAHAFGSLGLARQSLKVPLSEGG
jgi:curved DNA-binding protein CbpA